MPSRSVNSWWRVAPQVIPGFGFRANILGVPDENPRSFFFNESLFRQLLSFFRHQDFLRKAIQPGWKPTINSSGNSRKESWHSPWQCWRKQIYTTIQATVANKCRMIFVRVFMVVSYSFTAPYKRRQTVYSCNRTCFLATTRRGEGSVTALRSSTRTTTHAPVIRATTASINIINFHAGRSGETNRQHN